RTGALRRHGIQHIVDAKIAVRIECDAGARGAVLVERRNRFANQCCADALVRVLANRVAAREQQAAAAHADATVHVHLGAKIRDGPGPGANLNAREAIRLDVRKRAISIDWPRAGGSGNDAHAAIESHQQVARLSGNCSKQAKKSENNPRSFHYPYSFRLTPCCTSAAVSRAGHVAVAMDSSLKEV